MLTNDVVGLCGAICGLGQLDVLVGVVQRWPDQRAHGAIHNNEVLGAVGLRASHLKAAKGTIEAPAATDACVGDLGPCACISAAFADLELPGEMGITEQVCLDPWSCIRSNPPC